MATTVATSAGPLVTRPVRGAAAGIGAGIVFAATTMWFADSMGDPARLPLHMIAIIVQGDDAMMQGDTNATVGAIVHLVIPAGYGAVFAFLLPWPRMNAVTVVAAAVYGVLLYVVNIENLAPWLFTMFDMANRSSELPIHLVFGALLGLGLLDREADAGHRAAG